MTLPATDDRQLRTRDTEAAMWDLADERDVKQARLAYPSGWLWVAGEPAVRALLDALADAEPGTRYGTDDLAAMGGLAAGRDADLDSAATEQAIEALLSLGVLVADDGAYRLDDHSPVRNAVAELSTAVEAEVADVETSELETVGVPDDASGFQRLAQPEAVRLLVDALLAADADESLTQEDLHRLTGVSRKKVWHHVDRFLDCGVLAESGDEYVLATDSAVLRWARSLDVAVVGAILAPSTP